MGVDCDSVVNQSFGTSEFFSEQLKRLGVDQSGYLDKLEAYQADIEDVQSKVNDIFKKIVVKNTAIHKCNLYSGELKTLQSRLEWANAEVKRKVKQNESLKSQVQAVEEGYSEETNGLLKDVNELKNEVEGLKEDTGILQGKLKIKYEENEKIKSFNMELEKLKKQDEECVRKIEKQSKELADKEDVIQALDDELDNIELQIKEEKQDLHTFLRDRDCLIEFVNSKNEDINLMKRIKKKDLKEYCGKIAVQKNINLSYLEEINHFDELSNKLDKKITALKLIKSGYRDGIHSTNKNTVKNDVEGIKNEIAILQKKITDIDSYFHNKEKEDIQLLNNPNFESEIFMEDFNFELSLQDLNSECNSLIETLSNI